MKLCLIKNSVGIAALLALVACSNHFHSHNEFVYTDEYVLVPIQLKPTEAHRGRHPNVFIDSTFTTPQLNGVLDGVNKWTRDHNLTFTVTLVDKPSLFKMAQELVIPDAIYISSNESSLDPTCPTSGIVNRRHHDGDFTVIGATYVGRTWTYQDQAVICYNINIDDGIWVSDSDYVSRVICHEVGHALGLGHIFDQESVMNPDPNKMAGYVQDIDIHNVDVILNGVPSDPNQYALQAPPDAVR